MNAIETHALTRRFGAHTAVDGLDLTVRQGELFALLGVNGAGKTTTLHTITGLLKAKSGSVMFDGKELTKMPPHKIVEMGMAHVPEGRRVFAGMTVKENLEMGAYTRKDADEINANLEKVFMRFPRLLERKKQLAGTLSGGEQQMLAIGRAIMSNPKMLLLDEPSMGLSPLLVKEIFSIIKELNENGMTILLVEQNARKALAISDRAYVLETGHIVLEGNAKELLEDDAVKKAYLGG